MSNAAAGEAPAIPYAGSTVIALAHEHFESTDNVPPRRPAS